LFFDTEEVIFKTDFDDYFGLYCSNEFQGLIEANELVTLPKNWAIPN